MRMSPIPAALLLSLAVASPALAQTTTEGTGTTTQNGHASALKGAAVGGVAGHMMGHHTKTGMVAGAMVGHHMKKKEMSSNPG